MAVSLVVSRNLQRRQQAQRSGATTTVCELDIETAVHMLKAEGYTSSLSHFNLFL